MFFLISVLTAFILVQVCLGVTYNPWPRLILIPFFALIYLYKDKFDYLLDFNLSKSRNVKILLIILILGGAVRTGSVVYKIVRPIKGVEDIAEVYTKSADLLFKEGKNPYNHPVDYKINESKKLTGNERIFETLKYPPFLVLYYAPFTVPFGLRGIYLGNLLAVIAMLLGIFFLLKKFSIGHAYLGSILFLSTDYFFTKAFNRGINDFLPTTLLFFFIISLFYQRKKMAGVLLGLSVASKQLPGGLYLIMALFQKRWKEFFIATLTAAVVTIPFWATAIIPFFRNVILLNLYRSTRADSFVKFFPDPWPLILLIFAVAVVSFFAYKGVNKRSGWNLGSSWNLPTLAPVWFLFFPGMVPANYYVWIYPFMIMWYLSPKKSLALKTSETNRRDYNEKRESDHLFK